MKAAPRRQRSLKGFTANAELLLEEIARARCSEGGTMEHNDCRGGHQPQTEETTEQASASVPRWCDELTQAMYFPFDEKTTAPRVPAEVQHRHTTAISVIKDCVAAAVQLSTLLAAAPSPHSTTTAATSEPLVGVINMANEYNCGGGWERVRGSQEEYLFRKTSLALSLWPHRRMGDNRWGLGGAKLPPPSTESTFYPFTPFGGVLSPYVEIIADDATSFVPRERRVSMPASSANGDPTEAVTAPTPLRIACLSIAAQDLRPNRHYNRNATFSSDVTREKFRTCLHMALVGGCRAVVLGAIGCGAFRNPPTEVARCWHSLLGPGGEYEGVFEAVVFAITHSTSNIDAFAAVFPCGGRRRKKYRSNSDAHNSPEQHSSATK